MQIKCLICLISYRTSTHGINIDAHLSSAKHPDRRFPCTRTTAFAHPTLGCVQVFTNPTRWMGINGERYDPHTYIASHTTTCKHRYPMDVEQHPFVSLVVLVEVQTRTPMMVMILV